MILGMILAALGCCYIGAKLVRTSVQSLSIVIGNQIRKRLSYFTRSYLSTAVFGVFFNILAGGDTTMVAYSLAAFVAGDLIQFTPAVVMSIWGNIGTSLLFYLAVINMKLVSMYLIGISGIIYFFTNNKRYQALLGIMIGLALLLFGMNIVKESSSEWFSNPTIQGLVTSTANSWFYIFCFGLAMRAIFQLIWINVIISIVMLHSGLFDLSDIVVIHVASRLYTGLYTWFLSHHYHTPAKQLMDFQAIFSTMAGVLGIVTLILENHFGIPFVQAIILWMSPDSALLVVNLSLVLNIFTGLILSANQGLLTTFIEKLNPFQRHLEDERPEFLQQVEINNPGIAMDSLEKEHIALLKRIANYFPILLERSDQISAERKIRILNHTFHIVMEKVDLFFNDLSEVDLDETDHQHYVSLMYRQQLIKYLENILFSWGENMNVLLNMPEWQSELILQIKTQQDFFNGMIEACNTHDNTKIDAMVAECATKKDILDSIRLRWSVSQFYKLGDKEKQTIFHNATQMYEISMWVTQRILSLYH